MNKKWYSFIIIISTGITVNIMLFYDIEKELFLKYKFKEYVNSYKEDSSENKITKPNKDMKNKVVVAEEAAESSQFDNKAVKIEEQKEELDSSKDLTYEYEPAAEAVTIFKIDKATLSDRITLAEKAKLLYLSRKLSSSDFSKIKEYMDSSDEVGASTAIFKILKNRLSASEYNEVLSILRPYMNVDYIDEHASN